MKPPECAGRGRETVQREAGRAARGRERQGAMGRCREGQSWAARHGQIMPTSQSSCSAYGAGRVRRDGGNEAVSWRIRGGKKQVLQLLPALQEGRRGQKKAKLGGNRAEKGALRGPEAGREDLGAGKGASNRCPLLVSIFLSKAAGNCRICSTIQRRGADMLSCSTHNVKLN